MNKFNYKSSYATYPNCYFKVDRYLNDNLCIEICQDCSIVTRVTVNTGVSIPDTHIAIKNYSENVGMVDWLHQMNMIEDEPEDEILSGYVRIPIYRLKEDFRKSLLESI